MRWADVERLIRVLHRLVDGAHSVIVTERDLDVIAEADWVVDQGPEGGANGGAVVMGGTPEMLAKCQASHTGAALRGVLARGEGALGRSGGVGGRRVGAGTSRPTGERPASRFREPERVFFRQRAN